MQDREINLIDLIVEILEHWRLMIVWMLVGGALIGTIGYMQSVKAVEKQKKQMESQIDAATELKNLEETLTPIEKYNVKAVISNERLNDYYNQSLLMQIDAANVPTLELIFKVTAEDYETSCSIEKTYEDLLSCGLMENLGNEGQTDTTENQLSELITLNKSGNALPSSTITVIRNENADRDTFRVTIIHVTEEECRKLAEQVQKYLEEEHEQLESKIGVHELILVNKSFACVTDTELIDQQRLMIANLTSNNTNTEKLKKAFSNSQESYYTLLKAFSTKSDMDDVGEPENNAVIATPSVNIKYVILGMIVFAFAYVFYRLMRYVLNTQLRSTDDILRLYNIPMLGSVPQTEDKKKMFGFVDKWLLKICNRNKKVFLRDEAIGLTAVALKMQMKREGVDTAYCVGCNMKQSSMRVVEQLQNILIKENITIIVLNDILYNQDTMEQLQDAKAVFLMEKVGETMYDEIAKEQELLKRQNIKVLGAVIVE